MSYVLYKILHFNFVDKICTISNVPNTMTAKAQTCSSLEMLGLISFISRLFVLLDSFEGLIVF